MSKPTCGRIASYGFKKTAQTYSRLKNSRWACLPELRTGGDSGISCGLFRPSPEGELKIRRHLGGHSFEIFDGWKGVIGCVHAHGFENLRIFSQTILLKPRFDELAPPDIARLVVKHPAQAGRFPGRRSDQNTISGQGDRGTRLRR
jgi:hypothetical protein